MGNVRVVFDLAESKVSVEGGQNDLSELLVKLRELMPLVKEIRIERANAEAIPAKPTAKNEKESHPPEDIRAYARTLAPKGFRAQVGVLAFYVIKKQRQPHFTVEQMEDMFSLCGFKKPNSMSGLLTDASRRSGYVRHLGSGNWTVGPGGENLVLELEEGLKSELQA